MLTQIQICNFVLIEQATLDFDQGLTVISGETGAGKSILLDAISILLGAKADSSQIREGSEFATLNAIFDIPFHHPFAQRALENGINPDADFPNRWEIQRTISRTNNRSRITLQGQSISRTQLQILCKGLIDLCGQHEHQTLYRADGQLDLFDSSIHLMEPRDTMNALIRTWSHKRLERNHYQSSMTDATSRLEYLSFQHEELNNIDLKPDEDTHLMTQRKSLQQNLSSQSTLMQLSEIIEGPEGILHQIRQCIGLLKNTNFTEGKSRMIGEAIENARNLLADAAIEIHNQITPSAELQNELEQIESRLSKIQTLKRKHSLSLSELHDRRNELKCQILELQNSEIKLQQLILQEAEAFAEAQEMATTVHNLRTHHKREFELSVSKELRELHMNDARFVINIEEDALELKLNHGKTSLEFLIASNQGQHLSALAKTASGGEVSRLLLAIRSVHQCKEPISVYLFDEIDAGIGGATALSVGRKLQRVAKSAQTICVTHLPQIAAYADHHFVVEKTVIQATTRTIFRKITTERDTLRELARMATGDADSKESISAAKHLRKTAKTIQPSKDLNPTTTNLEQSK